MEHEVRFRASARSDLFSLYDYIAERAGREIAKRYIERIERTCRGLATFPLRGTIRDDLAPGIRTIGFERRVTIAFRVHGDVVEIVTIAYGGRNFEDAFD